MNILNPKFVYVPSSKQADEGLLARWKAQREREAEERRKAPAEQPANVKQLREKAVKVRG